MDPVDTLIVYDVNTSATKQFVEEIGSATANTSIASDVSQVALSSVRFGKIDLKQHNMMSMSKS